MGMHQGFQRASKVYSLGVLLVHSSYLDSIHRNFQSILTTFQFQPLEEKAH